MAFNLTIKTNTENAVCDKCKKPSSKERPLVDMWTTGRSYDQRNFIAVHQDCLQKAIAKAAKELIS